ncbi:MAG TPA: hypothetical protein VHB50_24180 [Bryobacteraceae bacterium]|nr:hypothetical protein [Bryobacteraceae bacterium]
MKLLIALLLAAPLLPAQQRPFRLDPGEFRWVPFTVKQIPTEVDCRFQVLRGNASVHMELLPMREFRRFNRGHEHETLAVSPDSRAGSFRRVVDERGQYAVIVINEKNAPPALVTLELRTDLNPNADVIARELPPGRRLGVILISFALFFTMLFWFGLKLLRAMNFRKRELMS